MVRVKA
jgi:hypothetical protein